jgi:carboxyl-terminal processing protease
MTPEERASRRDALSGSYVGIGVQLGTTPNDEPLVVGVFRDSPADKAGLRTGDVLLAVDGTPVVGSSVGEIVERIRGEDGTAVELTVRAGDDGPQRTLRIVRGEVEIDAVSWTLVPGTTTGLLRIEQFSNGVADSVAEGLGELRAAGADRLVLDLRGNPGGYVGEAVGTASQFLASGTVYVERNAQGEEKATPASPDGAWTDLPVVVLVDEGSASSSEIVAGALQDNDRATVMGATTFGTGTVLGEFALEDGSALRIGTVEWLTPDGRRIWHEGIEPDVSVSRPAEVLPTVPDDLRELAPARVSATVDAQLGRALELVAAD